MIIFALGYLACMVTVPIDLNIPCANLEQMRKKIEGQIEAQTPTDYEQWVIDPRLRVEFPPSGIGQIPVPEVRPLGQGAEDTDFSSNVVGQTEPHPAMLVHDDVEVSEASTPLVAAGLEAILQWIIMLI